MASKAKIDGIEFDECCIETLRQIKQKHELGKMLQVIVASSPFVLLFSNLIAGTGKKAAVKALNDAMAGTSFVANDWEIWARAVNGIPVIVKERCYQLSAFEYLRHKRPPLSFFWEKMADSFS